LFLFTLTFYFLVAISVGGTGSITGALIGTALVVWVRQYGDPLEQAYPLSTWLAAAGVVLFVAGVLGWLYRRGRRMRPAAHPLVIGAAAVGALAALLAWAGVFDAALAARWQGFGMRAIALSVLLVAIMIFKPAGIMGRREFEWTWLLRDKRDVPSDEERAQDAWLRVGERAGTAAEPRGAEEAAGLRIEPINKAFGGLQAITQLSLEVNEGEIVSVIGPNGAGKTTLFNLITGVYRPDSGRILFEGRQISGLKPNRIVDIGIARTFQNLRLFNNLTVLQNVLIAQHHRLRTFWPASVLRTPGYLRQERRMHEVALEKLAFFGPRLMSFRLEQP